jgi:8-oxo-dGTP diphosphatase
MTDLNESPILDVAAAVIGRNGSVLVARRAKGQHLAQKWEFPGGKIEENESPQECLHRELREELGVTVEVGEFIGESVFSYPEKRVRLLAYHVKLLAGDITLTVHDRMHWVKIQDLSTVDLAEADIPIALTLCIQAPFRSPDD